MSTRPYGYFLTGTAVLAIFAGCALAVNHHALNGSWQLIPERSDLHGEPAIQTGTFTIEDREGNIYVSRNFNYDRADQSSSRTFDTDARAGTSIREPGFKSKSEWKGDALQVTTTHDRALTVERFRLLDDGTMELTVDRAGHATETLFFRR